MRLDNFFEKFDLFADSPDAVAKMRELVLQLAFRGSLSGKSTTNASLSAGWEQRTIESICSSLTPGFACSRSHQVEDGHVHLRTHNISTLGTLNFDLLVRIDPKMVDPMKSSLRSGDILFNNTNSQELVGKSALVDRAYDYGFSNHITRLRLKEGVDPGFVVYYLTLLRNSGYFAKLCTRWINQAAVNTETLKAQSIPLPPLAEQKRIVAKVDDLMALCDRLEAQQQERETRHAALARASLARFADAPTTANLDLLFHKSYSSAPADLRKSILTLAVQGELVPQDAEDEPVAERSVSGTTGTPQSFEDPFEVPSTWRWKKLGAIAQIERGGSPRPIKDYLTDDPSGLNWIKISDTSKGGKYVTSTQEKIRLEGLSKTRKVYPGDFLLTNSMSFGRPYISKIEGCIHDGWLRIYPPTEVTSDYLYWLLSSPYVYDFFSRAAAGAVVQNLNADKVRELPVPLPPLAEQRRIVAKVDELMALVDALEAQLDSARITGIALVDAVVAELTAGA
jgi:type I restriction enzyme S subunit